MQQISNIQVQLNELNTRTAIAKTFNESLLDKYTIEDGIFDLNAKELTRGYFTPIHNYNSIEEASRNMNLNNVLRITEDQFIEGAWSQQMPETIVEHTVDIEYLKEIC